VYAVAFTRDGHTVAAASGDGPAEGPRRPSEKIQSNPIGRACSLTGGLNTDEWGVVALDVPDVDSCST